MQTSWALPRLGGTWIETLTAAGPPLLFALRLWASVCLALYVAFWLELDNPFWAGTSAAIVCLPQLGASLRKAWFRIIGTLVGATMIVVLTACFPQDRIAFLGLLALWCGLCAFVATWLGNFASYSAALAGYTAAIIAADTLGATGGPNTEVFMIAITRASDICIGIACAGIVLASTDLGGAQRQLAASFATLAAEIARRFAGMLALAGPQLPNTQYQRRELVRRVIALDSTIDQAIGESGQLRYYSPVLQAAVHGLFTALDGWRGVATHLARLPDETARQQAETILGQVPPELRLALDSGAPHRWLVEPLGLRRTCEQAVHSLLSLPARTPSLRLLSDHTAKVLVGILDVLDGLALFAGATGRSFRVRRGFQPTVPDWLPALVNAGRAFLTIGVVGLIWVATAWPDGAFAIFIAAIVLLLLSPRGDLAPAGTLAVTLGVTASILCATTIKFAVLPALETFPAFCLALGLYLIPVGFGVARCHAPAAVAVLSTMAFSFVPLLSPINQMTYDTAQFYNIAVAVLVGCGTAALAFRLLPPLPPVLRTRRLLAFALGDLRRSAVAPLPLALDDWEARMYGRLAALPDDAEPLQRAQLLATLSVGSDIMHLRRISPLLGFDKELDAALAAVAQGSSASARDHLAGLDLHLVPLHGAEPGEDLVMRARARILAISEALAQHSAYFDAGAPA
jgi:uncharacterized membrane protein YccC